MSTGTNIAKILDCTVTDTTATAGGVPVTTKVGTNKHDGSPAANKATVGSDVTFDSSGKVTGGLLEQVDDSMIAAGLEKHEISDGTFELIPQNDTAVAKVGHTYYTTLEDAFVALNENNYSLTLLKNDRMDGERQHLLAGGNKQRLCGFFENCDRKRPSAAGDAIKLVCKPDANDITDSPEHINVTKDITVYANGAEFDGDDLSIGTYAARQRPQPPSIFTVQRIWSSGASLLTIVRMSGMSISSIAKMTDTIC